MRIGPDWIGGHQDSTHAPQTLRSRLGAQAAAAMRVPAVVSHQMFALVGDVLRDFGQEVQSAEDLKVAARSAPQVGAGRAGKTAAVVFLGVVDHRTVVRQADDAGQAERTTQDVFSQSFQPRRIPRRQVNAVVHAEA